MKRSKVTSKHKALTNKLNVGGRAAQEKALVKKLRESGSRRTPEYRYNDYGKLEQV